MDRPVALVVDRDAAVRAMISAVLEQSGLSALGAEAEEEARGVLEGRPVSVLIVDLDGAPIGATGFVAHARQLWPAVAVIGLMGETIPDSAAPAIGAVDILPKPIETERLRRSIRRSMQQYELQSEMHRLRRELKRREGYAGLIGRSEPMERLREQVERLAEAGRPVWLFGEEGVGKELTARTLHAQSARRDGPFVVVPCGALSESAWLGGGDEPGVLRQAARGTLYLSQANELSPAAQRGLVESMSTSVEGPTLVAATRDDPDRAPDRGRIAEPLRALFGETRLRVPSLRERTGDIALLARHFVDVICEINHLDPIRISPEALDLLERHDWPGNVQQLRNAMEHAVILAREGRIRPVDLPDRIRGAGVSRAPDLTESSPSIRPFREAKREVVERFERAYLKDLLQREGGNVTTAARSSGMLRSALQRLLRKYGIKSADFRGGKRSPRTQPVREPRADD